MNWAALYLGCFVFGLLLTLVSLLAGSAHLHLPHFGHAMHGAHGALKAGATHGSGGHAGHARIPVINFASIVAFLAWFGATGYLLTHFHPIGTVLAFFAAFAGGLTGFCIVLWFLMKLMQYDVPMDPADYDMVGVLGRVNVPIRAGGTGEIIFSLAGTRRCAGARADDGSLIAKGEEVVVTRYERGIAYVKKWEELAGESRSAGVNM